MKEAFSNRVAQELAEKGGIGIRYGCHCAHILIKHLVGVGPVLERFQRIMATLFPSIRFPGLARISFGIENTEDDVDELIMVLHKIRRRQEAPNRKNVRQQIEDFVSASVRKVYS